MIVKKRIEKENYSYICDFCLEIKSISGFILILILCAIYLYNI